MVTYTYSKHEQPLIEISWDDVDENGTHIFVYQFIWFRPGTGIVVNEFDGTGEPPDVVSIRDRSPTQYISDYDSYVYLAATKLLEEYSKFKRRHNYL